MSLARVGAISLLLLVGLELLARLILAPPKLSDWDWAEPSPELGWGLKPGFHGQLFSTTRAVDRRGFLVADGPDLHAPASTSVLLLGDSRTFGNGVPVNDTYAELLEGLLGGTPTVNVAVPGYSSFQGRRQLELLGEELRPAVVVAAFGFNDRRYSIDASVIDSSDAFRTLARRAAVMHGALRLRIVRLTWDALAAAPAGAQPATDVERLQPRVSPEQYQRHLAAMATWCEDRRIRFLTLWLDDNPELSTQLDRGIRLMESGDWDAAEHALRDAVEAENAFSDAARRALGRLYRSQDREALAAAVEQSPRRLVSMAGGYPILASAVYWRATVDGAKAAGFEVVDARDTLASYPSCFLDFCHFDRVGHQRIAVLLANALRARTSLQHDS